MTRSDVNVRLSQTSSPAALETIAELRGLLGEAEQFVLGFSVTNFAPESRELADDLARRVRAALNESNEPQNHKEDKDDKEND